jgi:hypothetical protein
MNIGLQPEANAGVTTALFPARGSNRAARFKQE